MLPLGDSPNPPGIPVVTYLLVAANVAMYLFITLPLGFSAVDPGDPLLLEYLRTIAQISDRPVVVEEMLRRLSAYDLFVFRYGYRPVDPSVADLFFSMFLHGGLVHLLGNMLFLWIYGDNVEHRLGRLWYLVAYLGTGVAATLFHAFFDSDSPLPLVGASGAISGVLGFYFLWFPHNKVRILVVFFPWIMDVVTVPARLLLGFYLVVENLLPFLLTRGMLGGGVAYGAHIGGFIAGLAVAWFMERRGVQKVSVLRHRRADRSTPTQRIAAALARGNFAEAADEYFRLPAPLTVGVLSPEDSLRLADWLRERGHHQAALLLYRRHLRDYPRGPNAAEAHLGAGLVQLEAFQQPAAAYQHLLDVFDYNPSPEVAAIARDALREIERRQKFRFRRFS